MLNPKFLGIGIAGIVIILVVISISDFQVSETNNDDILLDENDIIKEIDFLGDSPLFRLFIYEDDIGILPNGDTYILEI